MAQKAEVELVITGKDKASGVMKNIGKAAKGIGIGVGAIGTAAIGMGVASVKKFADTGDSIQKMSLRTGFATDSLSEWRHVAEMSGTTSQDLEAAIRRISRVSDMAGSGLENNYTKRLEELGISVEEFIALPQEEKFATVVEKLAEVDDAASKTAIAFDLFGDAGTKLLPVVAAGSEGIADMKQEAHDLGLVFDQEAADSAAGFNDNITRLQGSFTGLMNEIAKALMPVLEDLIPVLTDLVKALPLEQIAELIGTLLPPLVDWFTSLLDAIPFDKMLKFVTKVMDPLMVLFEGIMGLALPLLDLLEPLLDILILILDILSPIIDAISWLLEKVGGVLGTIVGAIGHAIGWVGGLFGGQHGAIVTKPTFTMIGEAGPEAIVPLSTAPGASPLPGMAGGGVTNIYINVEGSVRSDSELIEVVREGLNDVQNRNVTTGIK